MLSKFLSTWTTNPPLYPVPPSPLAKTEESEMSENAPFEGPEKLLEIWFAPSAEAVHDNFFDARHGLKKVEREVWEEMLDIVKCKVLSVIQGAEMDAYLLSESSLFISPHKLILKTCGTTLNLHGLPRILEIAKTHAGFPSVYRCFYSRKSFMFPERQLGPHRDWKYEVEYLDEIFPGQGAAYTVGKVNGDHWLLYMTTPSDALECADLKAISRSQSDADEGMVIVPDLNPERPSSITQVVQDHTIEILMSDLSPSARSHFYVPAESAFLETETSAAPISHAKELSSKLGITNIFPEGTTTLDAYMFSPCGYSANALIRNERGEGYYTIHVTPEPGWSYASFECNVPLTHNDGDKEGASEKEREIPDLVTLIRKVVSIFQPVRLSLTLFIASGDDAPDERSAVENAQRGFKCALTSLSAVEEGKIYRRTDKINYEFGGYDLAFASFELR